MKKFFGMIACLALMFGVSCEGNEENKEIPGGETPTGEGLAVKLSSSIILADGEDSTTVTVTYDGEVIPVSDPDLLYFDATTAKIIDKFDTYSTTVEGEFIFYVAYKTENTKETPTLIRAYNVEIPDGVVDPQPEKLTFKHRAMLMQFTGTGCPNCPRMTKAIREVKADEAYAAKMIHTAIHSYNADDPCNVIFPGPVILQNAFGVGSYPYLMIDAATSAGSDPALIKSKIDQRLESPAKAGIAANVIVKGDLIVIRATVKAAEAGEYRVGAWLLEDDIEAEQSNNGTQGDYNIHHNSVRFADSQKSNYDMMGHNLGGIVAGGYGDHVFTIDTSMVGSTGCKIADLSKCHIVLFVSTSAGNSLYVANAIDIPVVTGEVGYDYE